MISQPRTSRIIFYKLGAPGSKLLGVLTFTDGKSLVVWDLKLHEQAKALYAASKDKPFDIVYTFKPNAKWGDALASIDDTRPDYERLDAARGADEAQPRSHKQGGFIAQQISKHVQRTVDEQKVSIDEVVARR